MIVHIVVMMLVYFSQVDGKMSGGIINKVYDDPAKCAEDLATVAPKLGEVSDPALLGASAVCVPMNVKIRPADRDVAVGPQ